MLPAHWLYCNNFYFAHSKNYYEHDEYEFVCSGSHHSSQNLTIPTQKQVILIVGASSVLETRSVSISGADAKLIKESSPGAGQQYLVTRVYIIDSNNSSDKISINYTNCGWGSYIIYARS